MTSGFQEEFRSAMDLTDVSSSGADDAVHRSTEGPRLMAPPPESPMVPADEKPVSPTGASEPSTPEADTSVTAGATPEPAVADEPVTATAEEPVTTSTTPEPAPAAVPSAPAAANPHAHAAFAADVTPAPGTGPELITPSRGVDPDAEAGGTSAA